MDRPLRPRSVVAGLAAAVALAVAAPAASAVTIQEVKVPTAASQPEDITQGPDGNLWFTEAVGNKIGRVIPGNPPKIADFATADATGTPFGITAAPDGNLWATEQADKQLDRVRPSNPTADTEFPVA